VIQEPQTYNFRALKSITVFSSSATCLLQNKWFGCIQHSPWYVFLVGSLAFSSFVFVYVGNVRVVHCNEIFGRRRCIQASMLVILVKIAASSILVTSNISDVALAAKETTGDNYSTTRTQYLRNGLNELTEF
jgi:hypothetical protein